ncbi:hypothetical protein LJR220_002045 [Bradyrhizobium sp. LjRoot220]
MLNRLTDSTLLKAVILATANVDGRVIGERKRRRPSDGHARP